MRDEISQAVRRLPQGIDAPPVVAKANADSQPIIAMTVQSKEKNELELSDYAEGVIAVIDEIPIQEELFLPELERLAREQNPVLQAQIINQNIARLQLKQVKSNRFPTLIANSGYQFSESEASLGFTTSATSRGINYGLTARLNLFDGFTQNQNEKIARIQLENIEVVIEQQLQTLLSQLGIAYQSYLTNVSLIDLDRNNETIARESLDITMDKFRIGTIPTIEFRIAQLNYINAVVRYSNAKFQAKLSEISLKEFAGTLTF